MIKIRKTSTIQGPKFRESEECGPHMTVFVEGLGGGLCPAVDIFEKYTRQYLTDTLHTNMNSR